MDGFRVAAPACTFLRDAAAERLERWGWFQRLKPCHGETQETGAGGAVSASPLPVSPTPTGVIPNRYSARGRMSRSAVRCDHPHRDPLPLPRARYPDYRHRLPAPLRGREEAAERPGGGGVSRGKNCVTARRRDRGGGSRLRLPLPVSPSPTGAIPHRYSARGRMSRSAVRCDHPHRDPFPLPVHGIWTIATDCPPPPEGAGGGRGSGRVVGVVDCSHGKTSSATRRRQGRGEPSPSPPSPSAPPPRG